MATAGRERVSIITMMHFIIDGYNLIGRQKGLRGDIESRRERLIENLSRYQQATGHHVTVVFDGWRTGRESEHKEDVGGVSVIFSRRDERADSVIARIAGEMARGMGNHCVVVTSDRELRKIIKDCGCTLLYAGEFEERLKKALKV